MTTHPSSPSVRALACSKAKSPDTAKKTTSHSRAAATENGSTVTIPYLVSIWEPADRSDPNTRKDDTGKFRFSNTLRISFPTAPVAPTIPTEYDMRRREADEESVVGGATEEEENDAERGVTKDDLGRTDEATMPKACTEGDSAANRSAAAKTPTLHFMVMFAKWCSYGPGRGFLLLRRCRAIGFGNGR